MTYKELYDKALWDLEHNKITIGEFDKMIEPLNKEIPKEEQTDGDLISRQAVNKLRKYNLIGGVHTVSLDDINKLPSARGYGDLISRTDLLNAIWQKEYGIDYDGVNLLNIKHIDIIEQMPSYNSIKTELDGDLISKFRDYQIEWLTSHNDIDLHESEMWVVKFLKDTAECFLKTELPSAEKTDSVLEDIKEEIEIAKWCDKETRLVKNCNASGLEVALDIINKHISRKEKE